MPRIVNLPALSEDLASGDLIPIHNISTGDTEKSTMTQVKDYLANSSTNYCFRAVRSGSLTTAAAAETTYPYNAETYDPNSNYNTSTYKYTIPVDGLYHFDAGFSAPTVTRAYIALSVDNTTNFAFGNDINVSSARVGCQVSADYYLTAGQTVEVKYFTSGAVSADVGTGRAYFNGHIITLV